MAWNPSLYLVPTLLAGVVAAALAVYAWGKRGQRAALPFSALMVGLCIWSLCYGVELGFDSLPPMLLWDRLAFVGSVIVPTAWLLLSVDYAGYEGWMTPRSVAVLAVEPAVTLALVWTNGTHGLIWRTASLDATGAIPTPELVFGPAYWTNFVYSYVLIAVGILLIGSVAVRAGRIYRRQSLVLLAGTLVPLGANATFNLLPSTNPVAALDLTPFAFAVTGVFFALALFRFGLLDLAPTAREALVDAMDDGIVVLDVDGRVVDVNPAARRALGAGVVGDPIADTPVGGPDGAARGLVELSVDGEARTYEVSSTPLTDFRDDAVGEFVLLRDITRLQVLRDQEQRLSVLNRVLRHNLRNELNVVFGRCESLAETLPAEQREHAATMRDAAARMLDLSEKARYVERTMAVGRDGTVPVDVRTVVASVAEGLTERYPAASVSVDGPDAAWVSATGRDQLAMAVENLGENAVVHDSGGAPRVHFDVERRDETVRVSVTDDGPGIPDVEWAAITQERETPLSHASGLGLWLVRWVVDASGGDLSFSPNDPTGSVVTIDLPRRPAPEEERPVAAEE